MFDAVMACDRRDSWGIFFFLMAEKLMQAEQISLEATRLKRHARSTRRGLQGCATVIIYEKATSLKLANSTLPLGRMDVIFTVGV
ncbi:MAG: hypothetical protein AAFV85_15785 [Cyanobacteria bacterium J06634_6]